MFAVDFKYRVVQKYPGFLRRRARHGREAYHHAVARIDADVADAHLNFGTGGILRGNHEFFGDDVHRDWFAAAMDGEGHARAEAHADLLAEIFPALGGLAVNLDDSIAGDNARSGCRRILAHEAHDEFVGRGFLHANHVKDHQKHERKGDIDERARESNRRARPYGLAHKIPFAGKFAVLDIIGVLPRHRHIAAERDGRNAVFRLSATITEKFLAETDAERVHLDVVPLGHHKVPEFVNRHEKAEPQKAEDKHQDIAENMLHHNTI